VTDAERFCWHPAARLVDAGGVVSGPGGTAAAVIADRPGAGAMRAAFAASAAGLAFRIGDGPAPDPGLGAFETLTSGTSGVPQRIRRSHASWLASFAVNAGLFGIGPGVRVAVLGRLVQSLSLYACVEALHRGAELHLLDGLRPDRQRASVAAREVGVLYATPSQLRLLLEVDGGALPALRHVLVGGSKLDLPTRVAVAALAPGAVIREFYGAAETSFITLADHDTPDGAVGRAYPGVELEVRDHAGPVAGGQLGEIWLRSPYVFQQYAGTGGPAVWSDGWLSVGEYGRMERGHLYLAGRASRMVTVADQNVFPEEIEAYLATLPGVRRVAVVARPDARRGHVIEAVVMGDAAQQDAVLAAGRARFGVLKAPRRLHWRADWPMLASGKTDLAAVQRGLA